MLEEGQRAFKCSVLADHSCYFRCNTLVLVNTSVLWSIHGYLNCVAKADMTLERGGVDG